MDGYNPKRAETYHQIVEMNDGIYHGFMQDGKRLGPGTLVHPKGEWRMEGIWLKDKAFIGKGRKEFCDGTEQEGTFKDGKY